MTKQTAEVARWLRKQIERHLRETHSDLKPSVLRRAAQRIGVRMLGNWVIAWEPVNLRGFKAVMATERATRKRLGPLIDLAAEHLFHGHVIPLQKVLALIDESHGASLGRCVCRSSKMVSDLEHDSQIYLVGDDQNAAAHLEALVSAYRKLRATGDTVTAPLFQDAMEEVCEAEDLSPRERLGTLFRRTYPYWEILIEHDRFTDRWRDNVAAHHKAVSIHKSLLEPFVRAHYHVRGAIFTGMEVVNSQYCICICPGPENDKGCSLVNWHYYSRMDHCLFPNEHAYFGQRRDSEGHPLTCVKHDARATRPCLGCGCEHDPTA